MNDLIIPVSREDMLRQQEYAMQVAAMAARPKKYHVVTYGCQMNAHDSEQISHMLQSMGMEEAPTRESADLLLFNTCCIRDNAERKAIGNVLWLKELKKRRDILVGICGCMMQQEGMGEKILRQYPFVDFAFGTGNLYRLPEYLFRLLDTGGRVIEVDHPAGTLVEGLRAARRERFKAYITIMHGCNNFCTYCIVPYVRGRERSRKSDDILREAEGLLLDGVSEIMLLGQNVNSYGLDIQDLSFPRLLRRLKQLGVPRIRFMTSHPKDLSDELIDEIAANEAVCPHLHLPVQSGSNGILQRMNRRYTREAYLEKVDRLRAKRDLGLTTDLIVAFPGETEADFKDTLALVERVRYDSAFTFIYSPRKGTRAAEMPCQIPKDVATDRIERLIAAQEKITAEILTARIGETHEVLVEGRSRRDKSQWTGKSGRNISVNFAAEGDLPGKTVPVVITAIGSNTLKGQTTGE